MFFDLLHSDIETMMQYEQHWDPGDLECAPNHQCGHGLVEPTLKVDYLHL